MKTVQHPKVAIQPWLYKTLRFLYLIPDYVVENDKTLSIAVKRHGRLVVIPLIKDADVMEQSGRVGQECGKLFDEWDVWPFQRKHKGHVYSGVWGVQGKF